MGRATDAHLAHQRQTTETNGRMIGWVLGLLTVVYDCVVTTEIIQS